MLSYKTIYKLLADVPGFARVEFKLIFTIDIVICLLITVRYTLKAHSNVSVYHPTSGTSPHLIPSTPSTTSVCGVTISAQLPQRRNMLRMSKMYKKLFKYIMCVKRHGPTPNPNPNPNSSFRKCDKKLPYRHYSRNQLQLTRQPIRAYTFSIL